jgi:hypothetical protein
MYQRSYRPPLDTLKVNTLTSGQDTLEFEFDIYIYIGYKEFRMLSPTPASVKVTLKCIMQSKFTVKQNFNTEFINIGLLSNNELLIVYPREDDKVVNIEIALHEIVFFTPNHEYCYVK